LLGIWNIISRYTYTLGNLYEHNSKTTQDLTVIYRREDQSHYIATSIKQLIISQHRYD